LSSRGKSSQKVNDLANNFKIKLSKNTEICNSNEDAILDANNNNLENLKSKNNLIKKTKDNVIRSLRRLVPNPTKSNKKQNNNESLENVDEENDEQEQHAVNHILLKTDEEVKREEDSLFNARDRFKLLSSDSELYYLEDKTGGEFIEKFTIILVGLRQGKPNQKIFKTYSFKTKH
jgi:hypothetical protein